MKNKNLKPPVPMMNRNPDEMVPKQRRSFLRKVHAAHRRKGIS